MLRDRRHGRRRQRPVNAAIYNVNTILSRVDLDRKKAEVTEGYAKRYTQNKNWIDQTKQAITREFDKAISTLEAQFTEAKRAAA